MMGGGVHLPIVALLLAELVRRLEPPAQRDGPQRLMRCAGSLSGAAAKGSTLEPRGARNVGYRRLGRSSGNSYCSNDDCCQSWFTHHWLWVYCLRRRLTVLDHCGNNLWADYSRGYECIFHRCQFDWRMEPAGPGGEV